MRSKQFNRMQKLAYFSGMIYWYTGFSKMIFTFLPIWFLLTMQPSMNAEFKELLFFFVPYFVGQIVSFYSSVTNTLSLKWAHYYEIAMAPHMCVSILKEHFASKNIFSVTPKEMRDDRSYFQTKVIVPHMILGGITILSWLIGFYYLQEGWIPFSAFMINFFWSLYNLIGIVICIRVAYHMAHIKHTEIAEIKNGQTASILIDSQQYSIILTDLLKTGMLFQSDSILPTGKAEMQFSYGEEMVVIQGVIKGSEHSMEFIYEKLNLSQQKAIVGIYVEHLQPSFDVEKYMHYI